MDFSNYLIPLNWEIKAFKDTCQFSKKPRGLIVKDKIPFFPMEIIPQNGIYAQTSIYKNSDEIGSGTFVNNGDVVVAKITPSFENGKQAIIDIDESYAYATTEVIPFNEIAGISDKLFLFYVLKHPVIRSTLAGQMEGSTGRQRLSKEVLGRYKIPLPPPQEQQKIAWVLSLVQDAIAQQEQLLTLKTELKKALIQKLFTEGTRGEPQKITEIGLIPETWDVIPLGKIAKIGNGATPKKDNHEYWTNGNIPWLTSTKIHESVITSPDQYVTQKAVEECHLPLVRAGSLLVAITGQGKTLGNSALVEFDTRINQHLAYIQFNEPTVVPIFILAFLQSRYEHFRQIARAGGSTKAALTCGFLKSYPVPLPTNQQEQLIIGQVFSLLNKNISVYESKIILLQDIFRTLLHQLMTAQIRVDDLNISAFNLKCQGGDE